MSFIFLPSSIRRTLYESHKNKDLIEKHKQRLNSGMIIQNPAEDPVLYSHLSRLSHQTKTLIDQKGEIDQAIMAINTSMKGIDALKKMALSLKSKLEVMKDTSSSGSFEHDLDGLHQILNQYNGLAKDASYLGTNLLTSDHSRLEVNLGTEESHITIRGAFLMSQRTITEHLSAPYNPFDDYTLIEALKNMTAARTQLTQIEGYTRILGFGLSLLDDSISRRGYLQQINQIIRLVGFNRGTRPGIPLQKASWMLALAAATGIDSTVVENMILHHSEVRAIFSALNLRLSRKTDNNRFFHLVNILTAHPYPLPPSLIAALKYMTAIDELDPKFLSKNKILANLLTYLNINTANDSLFNMEKLLPFIKGKQWQLRKEDYIALHAVLQAMEDEDSVPTLFLLSKLSLALATNRFQNVVHILSHLGITYGNIKALQKLLKVVSYNKSYFSISKKDLTFLENLLKSHALTDVFNLTGHVFLDTKNKTHLAAMMKFLHQISPFRVTNRGSRGAFELLQFFHTPLHTLTINTMLPGTYNKTVVSTTYLGLALERLEALDFDRAYKSGELAEELNVSIRFVEHALTALTSKLGDFSSYVSILNVRQEFATDMTESFKEGYNKLAASDTTEETQILDKLYNTDQAYLKFFNIAKDQEDRILELFR